MEDIAHTFQQIFPTMSLDVRMIQKTVASDGHPSNRVVLDFHACTDPVSSSLSTCDGSDPNLLLGVLSASATGIDPLTAILTKSCVQDAMIMDTATNDLATGFGNLWYLANINYFWMFCFFVLTVFGWFFEAEYQCITGFSPVVMQYLKRRPWTRVLYQGIWALILAVCWPLALLYPAFFRIFETVLSIPAQAEWKVYRCVETFLLKHAVAEHARQQQQQQPPQNNNPAELDKEEDTNDDTNNTEDTTEDSDHSDVDDFVLESELEKCD